MAVPKVRPYPWQGFTSELDWHVSKRPLLTVDGIPVGSHVATVRDDTDRILGVVGADYEPVQNDYSKAVFDAMAKSAGMKVHAYGEMEGGARVYALAKSERPANIGLNDLVERHALMHNRHDGSGTWAMDWLDIRLVCMNGMTRQTVTEQLRFRHTRNILERIEAIAPSIAQAAQLHQQETEQAYRQMAAHKPTREEVDAVLERLFPSNPELEAGQHDRQEEKRIVVRDLYTSAETCNLPGMEGTAWSLYNALTEYSDYYKPARNKSGDARLSSSWLGSGAQFKEQVYQQVTALLG